MDLPIVKFSSQRYTMETQSVIYSPKLRRPIDGMVKLAGIPAFDPATVIYLEGSSNYTVIHFNDGKKIIVAITLMQVASRLPALIRIHKSFAIAASGIGNIRWVGKILSKRVLVVTMCNKVRIAASRRKGNEIAPELSQQTGIIIK